MPALCPMLQEKAGDRAVESRDTKKSPGSSVLDLLGKGLSGNPLPFYIIAGKDDFLRRHACRLIRELVHGKTAPGEESEGALVQKEGDSLDLATFLDELGTASLFGGRTLLRVDEADDFVSKNRQSLEKHFAKPAWAGVAVLVVDSWPATTRLYKLTPPEALLRCELGKDFHAGTWAKSWCRANYQVDLSTDGAKALVELVGNDLGRLDQEIGKLASSLAEGEKSISGQLVDQLVASGTQEVVWKIFNAITAGKPALAISILDDQYLSGRSVENSMKLQGALASHLRKVARAARQAKSGASGGLAAAMTDAGIRPGFFQKDAEMLMRHLGGRRLSRLMEDLVTTDLSLKGGSKLPQRTILERLIVKLSVTESRGVPGG